MLFLASQHKCRAQVGDAHESCSTRDVRSSVSEACDSAVDAGRDEYVSTAMAGRVNIIVIEQD
jgi:hypothetical protein